MAPGANAGQVEFWNSGPGQAWVRHQADLDAMLAEVTALLVRASAPRQGERVLDVGCGAGASSFALARAVAPGGHVLGVDISRPLIARAEERKRELRVLNVGFEVADAEEHGFAPGGFDLVASRFGLMFFADPAAALGNIGRGLRPGGRIGFVAWPAAEENPWFAWPERIAVERLGPGAPSPPDAPGPTAFRDIGRVLGLLRAAGFVDCAAERVETELHHPGGLEAVVALATQVGPTARLMREKNGTDADRAAIAEKLAAAFRRFASAGGIRIPARVIRYTGERQ